MVVNCGHAGVMLSFKRLGSLFRYFNWSPEIIRLVFMTYVRFSLSLRHLEGLVAERGIDVGPEKVSH